MTTNQRNLLWTLPCVLLVSVLVGVASADDTTVESPIDPTPITEPVINEEEVMPAEQKPDTPAPPVTPTDTTPGTPPVTPTAPELPEPAVVPPSQRKLPPAPSLPLDVTGPTNLSTNEATPTNEVSP